MAIAAFHLLSRFGLGARPGDGALDVDTCRARLLDDLDDTDGARLPDLPRTPELLAALAAVNAKARTDATREARRTYRGHLKAELDARLDEARAVRTGLPTRLAMFWANHFAVQSTSDGRVQASAGAFEREAIRPHMLGRFTDLVLAVSRHPAMLVSLDNVRSVGPNSFAGRNGRGLNENHARELLELHTVGLHAGYGQADVTALARLLTGWTVGRSGEEFGRFVFTAARHEPGPQVVLGVQYAGDADDRGAVEAIAGLAAHPATAWHIAFKLARHFVADEPPPSLVAALAEVFIRTDGDLMAVTRRLVSHDLALTAPPTKLRSPQEYVLASLRVLEGPGPMETVQRALESLGQRLWSPGSPKGYPDDAASWLAPDAMTTRLDVATNMVQRAELGDDPRMLAEAVMGPALSNATRQALGRAESPQQAMALLLMSPEFQRR